MLIHVFKTDLKSTQEVNSIAPIFDLHPQIFKWNVDVEDIDNVLRVEARKDVEEEQIISLLKQYNVYVEVLKS